MTKEKKKIKKITKKELNKLHKLNQIEWHIRYNFLPPYPEKTVKGMLKSIKDYMDGKKKLSSKLTKNTNITVGDLFEDLRLDPDELKV
jgi:hypothetical protein